MFPVLERLCVKIPFDFEAISFITFPFFRHISTQFCKQCLQSFVLVICPGNVIQTGIGVLSGVLQEERAPSVNFFNSRFTGVGGEAKLG